MKAVAAAAAAVGKWIYHEPRRCLALPTSLLHGFAVLRAQMVYLDTPFP
jgi:hypothetical protein